RRSRRTTRSWSCSSTNADKKSSTETASLCELRLGSHKRRRKRSDSCDKLIKYCINVIHYFIGPGRICGREERAICYVREFPVLHMLHDLFLMAHRKCDNSDGP